MKNNEKIDGTNTTPEVALFLKSGNRCLQQIVFFKLNKVWEDDAMSYGS